VGPGGARGAMALDGIPVACKSFAFDAGIDVAQRLDANAANGVAGAEVTGRNMAMTIEVEHGSLVVYDSQAKLKAATTTRVGVQVGSITGSRIVVAAEAAQLTGNGDGDAEGVKTESLAFSCRSVTDAGDDEVYIAFT
ncbi:MAG: hypothetical protein ACPGWS_09820, partial [Solirubrobacterales bacterium]